MPTTHTAKLKLKTLLATFTFALFSTAVLAQPPSRDLLALDAWTLPGYGSLTTEEAFDYPEHFSFNSVTGVAFNSHGNLIVLQRGEEPLIEFDSEGNFVRTFGAADLFTRSHGLKIDSEDNIWVTDVRDHIVMKLDHDGNILMTLGTRGEAGDWNTETGSKLFNQPNDVAIDSRGNVYVAQGHGSAPARVLKFDARGNYLLQWGSEGSGDGQMTVAHSIEVDTQDQLYIADRDNFRVQIFDTEGNYLDQWNFDAMSCALYLHDDGHMYMTTGFDGEIAKLKMDGTIVGSLGSPGREIGQFGEAHF